MKKTTFIGRHLNQSVARSVGRTLLTGVFLLSSLSAIADSSVGLITSSSGSLQLTNDMNTIGGDAAGSAHATIVAPDLQICDERTAMVARFDTTGELQVCKSISGTWQWSNHQAITKNIADLAVTTEKINNSAVTTDKIMNLAVTTSKLDNGAVTTSKLDNGAVTTSKLDNGAVTTSKLDNGAVTTIKLGDSAVQSNNVGNGVINNSHIANNTITTSKVSYQFKEDAKSSAILAVSQNCRATTSNVYLLVTTGSATTITGVNYTMVEGVTGTGNKSVVGGLSTSSTGVVKNVQVSSQPTTTFTCN